MDVDKALKGMRDGDWITVLDALDTDHVLSMDGGVDPSNGDRCEARLALIGRSVIFAGRIGASLKVDVMPHDSTECAADHFDTMVQKSRAMHGAVVAAGVPGELTISLDGREVPPDLDRVLSVIDRVRSRLGAVAPDDLSGLFGA